MSEQDARRQDLYDALDDVEATTKRVTGDKSLAASTGQNSIIDGVNAMRHTVGTIPKPTEPAVEPQPGQGARANQAADGCDRGRAQAAGRPSAPSTEEIEERG